MRGLRTTPILISAALILAGCNSNDTADTAAVDAGTTVVETTTPTESTESTVEAEDHVVDNPGGLNGSYQLEWDSDELWEALGDPPTEEVNPEAGVVIFTFDNGQLEAAWQTGPYAGEEPQMVTYEVFRDRITMVFREDDGTVEEADAAWDLTGGQLRFSDFTTSSGGNFIPVFLGTKPLIRIDGPTSAADRDIGWTHTYGDAARTGVADADAGPIGQPIELWRFQADAPCNQPPIVVAQTAFVACEDGNLYALDVADGGEIWRFESGASFGGGLAAAGDLVYAADDDGILYAVEIATGEEIWSLDGQMATAPAVEDGLLTVGTLDGALIALDPDTGAERWRSPIVLLPTRTGTIATGELRNPSVAGGLVYIVSTAAGLTAVDAETGELAWQSDTAGPAGSVRVIEGVAYVGASGYTGPDGDGHTTPLSAFDADTGDLLWQREPLLPPTVLEGVGYSGSLDKGVHAFDTSDGSDIWHAGQAGHGWAYQPPVIAGDIIYFFSEGDRAVYALDAATGDELWEIELDGKLAPVAVADRRLYIATSLFVGTELGEIVAIGGSDD